MAYKSLTQEQMQEAIDAFNSEGSKTEAAKILGLNINTYRSRYNNAIRLGLKPNEIVEDSIIDKLSEAHNKIRQLETSISTHQEQQLTAEYIKKKIIKLRDGEVKVPNWLIKKPAKKNFTGVPTLFASDWHWGEVVDPNQINGVNEYNLTIAQNRAKYMIEKAVDLLKNYVAHANYPGIVFALGGDMVSGDIHEELSATNEKEIMPTVLDLFGVLCWCINTLADEFGNVFIPCVSGNHGRNCYDEETEILTQDGWKKIHEVNLKNDLISVFYPEKDSVGFEKPEQWYVDNYTGEMISIKSKGVDLLVTPEHKLWVRFAGKSLINGKKYEYGFSKREANEKKWSDAWNAQSAINGWVGHKENIVIDNGKITITPSSDWSKFFGWFVSEGSVEETRIIISQSASFNPVKYEEIFQLLIALGFNPKKSPKVIRFNSIPLSKFLNENFGIGAKNKKLPFWLKNWPKELLNDFFEAAMKGDGCWDKRNKRILSGAYTTTSDALMDDMQEVCFKLGYSSKCGPRYSSQYKGSNYVGTARKLNITKRTERSMAESKKVNYSGKIWCPTVSSGLVIVRRNGRITISGNTFKIRNKGRNFTSFDWLTYQFLAKRFENDPRVTFHIPDGSDAYYSVFGHKYLLTHGDQFRGGDGVIGALGPIIRGDHRKRSRNAQIDMSYDTMMCGHWHQLIQLERLIVNSSLKGYDEYAYSNNFGYELPRQAMWITHPEHGITFSIPVYVEKQKKEISKEWITWK